MAKEEKSSVELVELVEIVEPKSSVMVGIKGNGKAGRMKLATQVLLVFAFAVAVVASVKTFGTASWHAKSVREEHQDVHDADATSITNVKSSSVADASVIAKEANAEDMQDSDFIKIVWGNLDGEIGSEGVYLCTI